MIKNRIDECIESYVLLQKKKNQNHQEGRFIKKCFTNIHYFKEKDKASQSITFHVTINNESIANNEPVIGIGINDQLNNRIATVMTTFQKNKLTIQPGENEIVCEVPNCNLAAGEYKVKVAFGDSYKNLEEISEIHEFEIKSWDYFGTGVIPNRNQGSILLNANWKIK